MVQGDIVLIPFPFTDQSNSKRRPALIISGKNVNSTNDVILVQITSNNRADHFSIAIDNKTDLTQPLNFISEIRCNKLLVAEKSLVIRQISHVKPDIVKKVVEKINLLFQP